jgi:hypothetical protein
MANELKVNRRAVPKQPLPPAVVEAIKVALTKAALKPRRNRKARDSALIAVRSCRWEPVAAEMKRLYLAGFEIREIAAIVRLYVPGVTDAAINAALRRFREKEQAPQAQQRRAA